MTSLKWMTIHKPHPVARRAIARGGAPSHRAAAQIYRAIKKRGYNPRPVAVIVICQLIYTMLTFLPVRRVAGGAHGAPP